MVIEDLTLAEASRLLDAGQISAVELTDQALARIDALDTRLRAHTHVFHESARADARRADEERAAGRRRGPLHGIPLGIKDLLDIAGYPTGAGMTVCAGHKAEADATVVRRLRAAGAVIVGKQQLSEGATVEHHPAIDPPRNPWSLDHWTGVSSSGTGAAVAAGFCLGALGTDTGGSVRFPAAACGITGFKPSYGRVSRAGLAPLSQSFDHIGPLARTAEDAELILAAIAGRDEADPTSLADPYVAQPAEIAGMRIGIDPRWCRERVHPSVEAALREAEEVFRELGATVVEVDFPSTQKLMSVGLVLMQAEQVMNHRQTWPSRRTEYGPALAASLDAAPMLTVEALTLAGLARDDFRGSVAAMFTTIDLFLCPVMPIAVPSLPLLRTLLDDMMHFGDRVARYTIPFDASGSPAISLPAGFDEAGLPSSIQLVGPVREDARVLAAGKAFQSVTGWHLRRPALVV